VKEGTMNIGKLTLILSVTALLGAASPVLADETLTGPDDQTGLSTLGIDISSVGGSSAAVGQFLAQLPPDTLRGVIGGCQTAVTSQSGYAPAVVGFCRTALNQAPAGAPALGYAQEPNRAYVPSPIIERGVEPNQTLPTGDIPAQPFTSTGD
jgi:hypothetical protein